MPYRNCILILLVLLAGQSVTAQRIKSMDFRNQSIVDILMVLAEASNTSIIPDETVDGTASFHFSESDFEESLALFLANYKLFYRREGNVIRVSRIKLSWDRASGRISMEGDGVDIEQLFRAMAKTIQTSILYDPLPKTAVSVAVNNLEVQKALEICMLRLTDYSLERGEDYYYIRRLPADIQKRNPSGRETVVRSGDAYSVNVDQIRFQELLAEFFGKAGREYSLLTKTDAVLDNCYFADKDFETMLRLILEQGNADYILRNEMYYIVEVQRRDTLKKLKETRIIGLRTLSAQEFPSLLPAEMAAGNIIKIDKNNNALIVTGTPEEINPIVGFIERIDRPAEGLAYRRFELRYLNARDVIGALPQKLVPVPPVPVPGANAFVALGGPEGHAALEEYLAVIDRREESYPVTLKYIRIDELLKALPPSVTREELVDSGFPNLFFFTGRREKREEFLRELALIDRPKPQIRYELLVIEYMKNNEVKTSRSVSAGNTGGSPGTSFMGNMSNIFNLNFDVVAKFGYQFAANLSVQLGENTAQVYADTTLNGLSGQEIKFQNTDTYRYQEFEVDADTGSITRTGVTREISSGLIVALNGWVSGDDMITMSVNATVSKQNNNGSGDAAAIPSTSERIVNTHIRTPSGKPIILSGLIKEDVNRNRKKFPLLGDIPLLGFLFRDQGDTKEKTEIVIYIVPYICRDENGEQDVSRRIEGYYHAFIGGNQE
ncbi:MAG: type II and III secretion system protein [Treponema sp.]|jgi:type II secretory pathway component GspD/PulD (secretin)|nr:type II and III secretion system protein [Treponema sp.]